MHTVDGLIARGGWGLDDVQARGRANPDTFWLPPEGDLARIEVGSAVRLIFAVVDQADTVRDGRSPYGPTGAPELTVHYERMWLWVERLEGDDIVGVLQNVPVATHTRLVPNARVRFRRSDVIDIEHVPPVSMWSEIEALAKIGFPHLDERPVERRASSGWSGRACSAGPRLSRARIDGAADDQLGHVGDVAQLEQVAVTRWFQ
jgi:hypothetical protein